MDHVDQIIEQWHGARPDLDVSPIAVVGRLHRIARHLTDELVRVYAAHGLGEGEFDVLATLRRSGPPHALTPSALAESTMVTSGAITKRVDRCLAQGWVARGPSTDDGRGRLVTLTPAGQALIDRAFAAHIANEHHLLAGLSARDRDQLASLLVRWGDRLGVS